MDSQTLQLFKTLRDGVFVVAADGTVRFANDAANDLIPCEAGQALPNVTLRRLIALAGDGRLAVPFSTDVELDEGVQVDDVDVIRAHLQRSPVTDDFVVVLHNVSESQFYGAGMSNFARMVDREYREALIRYEAEFAALMAEMHHSGGATAVQLGDFQRLIGEGRDLLEGLGRLARLAQVAGGSTVAGNDRIDLMALFGDAIARCMGTAESRGIRIHVERPAVAELPVHASRLWLGQALYELLDNAVRHGPEGSDVVIACRNGEHSALISVGGSGVPLPKRLHGRIVQPGYRGEAAARRPGLGLGLALARKVVELHGGRLLVDGANDGGMVTFGLELPMAAANADGEPADGVPTDREPVGCGAGRAEGARGADALGGDVRDTGSPGRDAFAAAFGEHALGGDALGEPALAAVNHVTHELALLMNHDAWPTIH